MSSASAANTAVIVLAAGSGTRLGEPIPKAAVRVHGRTLLDYALEGALASGVAEHVVVTVPADCSVSCPELLEDARRAGALITAGGDTRTASVVAALDALKDAQVPVDYVLIHDCARAFTPPQVYHRVLEGLGSESPQGVVRAVQTPQGFEVAALLAAHERSRSLPAEEAELLTDDAMAMEAAGEPVLTVAGDADAFKVTTPMDLRVARALFGDSAS